MVLALYLLLVVLTFVLLIGVVVRLAFIVVLEVVPFNTLFSLAFACAFAFAFVFACVAPLSLAASRLTSPEVLCLVVEIVVRDLLLAVAPLFPCAEAPKLNSSVAVKNVNFDIIFMV